MRRKKKGHLITGIFAGIFLMSLGTVSSKANNAEIPYNVSHYAYGEYYDNVSDFARKHTDSYMLVACEQATGEFRVSALGSNNGVNYADCSGGYRYYLKPGQAIGKMVNFVNENGYSKAGILGESMSVEYFYAIGFFIPDI